MMSRTLKPQLVIRDRCEEFAGHNISLSWKRCTRLERPRLPNCGYVGKADEVEPLVERLKAEATFEFDVVDLRVKELVDELGLLAIQWRHFWGSYENAKYSRVHLIKASYFIDGSLYRENALCGKENNGREDYREPKGHYCEACAKVTLKLGKKFAAKRQAYREYRDAVNDAFQELFGITWADASGDSDRLHRAMRNKEEAREFVHDWGEKYDLERTDSPYLLGVATL